MKLLKLKVDGLNLFKEGLNVNFVAQQKVTEDNKHGLHPLFSTIHKQNVLGIIGINASGKTSALKVLAMILDIYLKNGQINDEKYTSVLKGKQITIESYFLSSHIIKITSSIIVDVFGEISFDEELLWMKKITTVNSRNNLFEFTDKHLKIIRSEEDSPYLSNYTSIMISQIKNEKIIPSIMDLLDDTNINVMRVSGKVPNEIIRFLDNNVDFIKMEDTSINKHLISIKFNNQQDIVYINDITQLWSYLSSGTIKGLNVFACIQHVLATGGYLIMDEIENHFNREIVRSIIGFFKNSSINPFGATIIFTTHYAELLDDFERNDSVYIAFKDKTLHLENLSTLLKRNDYKKSEVYKSSYLGNTAPSYDSYMDLKKYFQRQYKDKLI